MLQFLILAKDSADEGALEKRLATRPFHLEGASKLMANNHFVIGGATLDENGNMNGSMMVVQFETQEEMKTWFDNEPYVTAQVWNEVEIRPFRVADVWAEFTEGSELAELMRYDQHVLNSANSDPSVNSA